MDVEEYRKTRYKGIDQRIINKREQNILRKIFSSMNRKSISVLDIPCGYGRFSELFMEKSLNLTSADISFPMVLAARKYSPNCACKHYFLVGDISHLPLKEKSFDCIVTVRLFQHILRATTRFQILKELHRVSRKTVIISFYKYNLFHSIERWLRCRIKNVEKKISMLHLDGFARELNSAGFRVVEIFPVLRCFHAQNIALLRKIEP